MNAINLIAPYKVHGQWVFDTRALACHKNPLLLVPIPGSIVWWLTFPMPSKDSRSSVPVRRFQAINIGSIGGARKAAATGIIPRTSIWKAGCVRRFLNISRTRQKRFMRRSKHRARFQICCSGASEMNKGLDQEVFSDFVRALAFASRKHSQQKRKDAEASPYINHPIHWCLSLP